MKTKDVLGRGPQNGTTLYQNGAVPGPSSSGLTFLSRNKNDRNKLVPGTRPFCGELVLGPYLEQQLLEQCSFERTHL